VDGYHWPMHIVEGETPMRRKPVSVSQMTVAQLKQHLKRLQRDLAKAGKRVKLDSIDLQDNLMKQQQTIQTLSNVSKLLHDTASAVLRKIG